MKQCILYDRPCTDCGECDRCDLDPSKICDNCCKCIEVKRRSRSPASFWIPKKKSE